MARILLSFLGTSDYFDCVYCLAGERSSPTRFIQLGLLETVCSDWDQGDRIIVFSTKEAEEKNWIGSSVEIGLSGMFEQHPRPIPFSLETIPVGKNESQIWEIFDLVFDAISEGDQVYLDVTHAFRSIPILALVVLNFATVVKRAKIAGIYYGAIEALGSRQAIQELPTSERKVPIYDLTVFQELLQWCTGVDRFLGSSDATLLYDLAYSGLKPVLANSKGSDMAAANLRALVKDLREFGKALSTCRSQEISLSAKRLAEGVRTIKGHYGARPFGCLLDLLKEKFAPFDNDPVRNGIRAAKMCRDQNKIQQAFTLLQESLISYFVREGASDCEIPKREYRKIVNEVVAVMLDLLSKDEAKRLWKDRLDFAERVAEIIKGFPHLLRSYDALRQRRNDLNHAGMNDRPASPDVFERDFDRIFKEISGCIN